MMDSITVGAKIKMTDTVTSDYPVGSTATIIYIDEMPPLCAKRTLPFSGSTRTGC